MPAAWNEDDLCALVGRFGTVLSTYVMRDSGMEPVHGRFFVNDLLL